MPSPVLLGKGMKPVRQCLVSSQKKVVTVSESVGRGNIRVQVNMVCIVRVELHLDVRYIGLAERRGPRRVRYGL